MVEKIYYVDCSRMGRSYLAFAMRGTRCWAMRWPGGGRATTLRVTKSRKDDTVGVKRPNIRTYCRATCEYVRTTREEGY